MNALILCAGYGSRMGALTRQVPKPLLLVRNEIVLDRILRQVQSLQDIKNIYINVSYRAQDFAEWLLESNQMSQVSLIWEPIPLGSFVTLMNLSTASPESCLVIHGDLYLSRNSLQDFVSTCQDDKFNYVAYHSRLKEEARSQLILSKDGFVSAFFEGRENQLVSDTVLSNSGIYLFNEKLMQGGIRNFYGTDIAKNLLSQLAERRMLKGVSFQGFRYSLETVNDYNSLNGME